MSALHDHEIAYYPGETPIYDGELTLSERSVSDAAGLPTVDVTVPEDESLNIAMLWRVESPYRMQFAGYFLRRVGKRMICNVDLELPTQPSQETIARALIAAMDPDVKTRTEA